jgi:hypothetical protein
MTLTTTKTTVRPVTTRTTATTKMKGVAEEAEVDPVGAVDEGNVAKEGPVTTLVVLIIRAEMTDETTTEETTINVEILEVDVTLIKAEETMNTTTVVTTTTRAGVVDSEDQEATVTEDHRAFPRKQT